MPSLTTLRIDPVTQGEEAGDMLLAQMNGESCTRLETPYENRLIIGESCGYHLHDQAPAS